METIVDQKNRLRTTLLEKRSTMGERVCHSKSQAIKKRVLALPEFAEATIVHFYLSDLMEVQTDGLIEEAFQLQKQVVVPLLDQVALSQINELDPNHFTLNRLGMRSPKKQFCKAVSKACVDLWIIPGIGYDRMGNRLGRGAGYYDRLLSGVVKKTIGLAFECQIVEAIPLGENDCKVDQIITEERTIICGGINDVN